MTLFQKLQEEGYAVLEGLVSPHVCDEMKKQALSLVEAYEDDAERTIFSTVSNEQARNRYFTDSSDRISFFWEEEAFNKEGELLYPKSRAINKIGHGLHRHDPVFREFSESSLVKEIIQESAFLKEPLACQSMYIFKQPQIGGEVVCHRDSTFIHTEPSAVLGLWLAVEDATQENGCLLGIPGRYEGAPTQLFKRGEQGCYFEPKENEVFPLEKAIPLEVPKGSLILFHGMFPHLSHPNRSEHSRHAFTLHFIDKKNNYLASNWNQSEYLTK